MIRLFSFLSLLGLTIFQSINMQAQAPVKLWDKRFGGGGGNQNGIAIATNDGGFLLGGDTDAGLSGDKSEVSRGLRDYWIVKVDSNGNKIWDKTFGGSGTDDLVSMAACPDGGYVLAGFSNSPISGDKTQSAAGSFDYWVVKTDASGYKVWDKRFGGSGDDRPSKIIVTTDGGYLVGGGSLSGVSGNKSQPSQGGADYWIVKLTAAGVKSWDKTFGGSQGDDLRDIIQTADGNYLATGLSFSGATGDKSEPGWGNEDFWTIKISPSGSKIWDKRFGGSRNDEARTLLETANGDILLVGYSASPADGDKTEPLRDPSTSTYDIWAVRTDANGVKIWDKRYGAEYNDYAFSVVPDHTSGFVLFGYHDGYYKSGFDRTESSQGNADYWALKIDDLGTKVWDKRFGGTDYDFGQSIIKTADGGYLIAGHSYSTADGDRSQNLRGTSDYWILKMSAGCDLPVIVAPEKVTLCPWETATLNASGADAFVWQPGNLTGSTIQVAPTQTTNYTVASASGQCTNSMIVTVVVSQCNDTLDLNLKVWLEGAYNSATNLMNTDLRSLNLIPTGQPYFQPPFNYSGTENYTGLPANAVDWVLVELRDTGDLTNIIAQKAALVMSNGAINTEFAVPANKYYLTISHRNHLTIGYFQPIQIPSAHILDLTQPSNLMGGNAYAQILPNGQAALPAADGKKDNYLTAADYILWQIANSAIGVYLEADFNMDGFVSVDDYLLWVKNNGRLSYFAD